MAAAAMNANPIITRRSRPVDSAPGSGTSFFQSRSECSWANSPDRASTLPSRLTAMRKASSGVRPAAPRSAIWSRRWPSSSSASAVWTACCCSRLLSPPSDQCFDVRCLVRTGVSGSHGGQLRSQRRDRRRHLMPEVLQGAGDHSPLAALLGERLPAVLGDPVVLAPPGPAAGRHLSRRPRRSPAVRAGAAGGRASRLSIPALRRRVRSLA